MQEKPGFEGKVDNCRDIGYIEVSTPQPQKTAGMIYERGISMCKIDEGKRQSNCVKIGMRIHHLMHMRKIYVQDRTGGEEAYPGQYPILAYVADHKGCTQVEVADAMMTSASSVALSTKRLQKMGLLEKQVDENNLRCKHLSVTEEGWQTARRFHEAHMLFDEASLKGFTDEEMELLASFLERMLGNGQKELGIDDWKESLFSLKRPKE